MRWPPWNNLCSLFLGVDPICIQLPAVKFSYKQAGKERVLCSGVTDVTEEAPEVTLSGRASLFA